MRNVMKTVLLSAAAVAMAGAAGAATIDFQLTGSYNAHFQIDSNPVVTDPDQNGFAVQNVYGNFPGSSVGYAADVIFYTLSPGNFGGLEIDDNYGVNPIGPLVVTDGPQLFTGPTSAPVFTLGTFNLTEHDGDGAYRLVVSRVAAVPEASTWAMAVMGFGVIGAAARRRNRNVSVRFAA